MSYPIFRFVTLDPSMKFVARHETAPTLQYLTASGGTTSIMSEALVFALPYVPALHGLTYDAEGWWTDAKGEVQFRAIEFRPDFEAASKNILLARERLEAAVSYCGTAATSARSGATADALTLLRSLRGMLKYAGARLDQARVQLEANQPSQESAEAPE